MPELNLAGLFDKEDSMPDDLGEYDNEVMARATEEYASPSNPYRGTLAGLFTQRRVLLGEVRAKLEELVALNNAIEQRAQMVVVGYTGVGRLGRWLMRRAWRRVLRGHDVSLGQLLSDMPKGHCADHWECKHPKGVLSCDDVAAERAALDELWGEGQLPPEPPPPAQIPRDMKFVKSRD